MSTTVQEIIDRVQPIAAEVFQSAKPAAFIVNDALVWIKDCYDKIGEVMRMPLATKNNFTIVADQRGYDLPTDILHDFEGIVSIDFGTQPLRPWNLEEIKRHAGDAWTSLVDVDGVQFYFLEDNSGKFSVLNAPSSTDVSNGTNFTMIYVQAQDKPTSFASNVPAAFVRFIPIMPLYIIGRMKEKDDVGAGSAFISEFEARLKTSRVERKRRTGKRVVPETYSLGINNYIRTYRGAPRRGTTKPSW